MKEENCLNKMPSKPKCSHGKEYGCDLCEREKIFKLKDLKKVARQSNLDQRKTLETIEVQTRWLKTLLKLSEQAEKDIDKWYKGTKPLMPMSISKLIGYSNSTKYIIKSKNEKD